MRFPRSLLILVVLLGVGACTRGEATEGTGVRTLSEPLPLLQGEDLQGKSISSTDLAGHVLVVNAWATWEWVRTYHVPYSSIADASGRFAASFDYFGLPDTYIVDAGGTMRYAIGPGATTATQLSGLLDQVLAVQTSASMATATNSPAR